MYRYVFTVGVAVIRGDSYALSDALIDYSYINARNKFGSNVIIARCLTGLGPNGTDRNGVLGGWYFNGNSIPNGEYSCGSATVEPLPGGITAVFINIHQCTQFSTAAEGVYTCKMMNSSMMNESVRLGVYFTGRSESFDLCNSIT